MRLFTTISVIAVEQLDRTKKKICIFLTPSFKMMTIKAQSRQDGPFELEPSAGG